MILRRKVLDWTLANVQT